MQRAWQIWLLPALFFIFDYAAVVAAEWSAIALRNAVDYWTRSVYTGHIPVPVGAGFFSAVFKA